MSHDPRHVAYLILAAAAALSALPAASVATPAARMTIAQAETPPPEGEPQNDKKKTKNEQREQKSQENPERKKNGGGGNPFQQQNRAVQQGQPPDEGNDAKKQQQKALQEQFREQQRQKREADQLQKQQQREQQKVRQDQFKEQLRQKREADQLQKQQQLEQQKTQQEQAKEQLRQKREADQLQKQQQLEQQKMQQEQAKEQLRQKREADQLQKQQQLEQQKTQQEQVKEQLRQKREAEQLQKQQQIEQQKALQEQQRQKLEAEQQQRRLEREQKKLVKEPPQQQAPNVPENAREGGPGPKTGPGDAVAPPQNPPAIEAGKPDFAGRKFDRAQQDEIRKSYRRESRQQRSFDELKKDRRERTIADGKLRVIEEPDRRVIVKQDNRTFIRHDESERFRRIAPDARTIRRADGTSTTFMTRSGGVRIYDVTDRNGRLLYRYRRYPDGREVILIDNRRYYRRENNRTRDVLIGAGIGLVIGSAIALATPEVRIPRDRYIVDYGRATDDDLYEALTAPPVERLDRGYSLEEIRYSAPLRDRMRRIDLDTVTFDFGSWEVGPDQARALDRLAQGINRMLERNPDEIVMIEGHTDAVGSEEDNLTLSDRRAQSVAEILTTDYGVPPENLVTQGYGEEQLKIPTDGPERANRRITVRRIGPLLSGQFDGDRSSGGGGYEGDRRYDDRGYGGR